MKIQNPQTPEEWQEAVDMASFLLIVHSAELYGLVKIDLFAKIDAERCEGILYAGRFAGIYPKPISELTRKFIR